MLCGEGTLRYTVLCAMVCICLLESDFTQRDSQANIRYGVWGLQPSRNPLRSQAPTGSITGQGFCWDPWTNKLWNPRSTPASPASWRSSVQPCKQSSYKLTASEEALDFVHNSGMCTRHVLFLASCSDDVEEEKDAGGKGQAGGAKLG